MNDSPRSGKPPPAGALPGGSDEAPTTAKAGPSREPEAVRRAGNAFHGRQPLETAGTGPELRNRGRRIAQDRRRRRPEGYGYPRIRGLRLPAGGLRRCLRRRAGLECLPRLRGAIRRRRRAVDPCAGRRYGLPYTEAIHMFTRNSPLRTAARSSSIPPCTIFVKAAPRPARSCAHKTWPGCFVGNRRSPSSKGYTPNVYRDWHVTREVAGCR